MVDPDTTKITTMETTGTYIFSCDFQRGPSHEILSQWKQISLEVDVFYGTSIISLSTNTYVQECKILVSQIITMQNF